MKHTKDPRKNLDIDVWETTRGWVVAGRDLDGEIVWEKFFQTEDQARHYQFSIEGATP